MSTTRALAAAALFSPAIFRPLTLRGDTTRADAAIAAMRQHHPTRARTNAGVLRAAFTHMRDHYRSEYVYREAITREHCTKNAGTFDAACLHELRVGNSIADLVIVNGKGTVYEIKTELDSPQKLQSQLADYYRAFSVVNLVVCPELVGVYDAAAKHYPVGLTVLEGDALVTVRKAVPITALLEHRPVFNMLRQAEREQVLTRCLGGVPEATSFRRYRTWLSEAESIDVADFQLHAQKVLKQRRTAVPFSDVRRLARVHLESVALHVATHKRGLRRIQDWLAQKG